MADKVQRPSLMWEKDYWIAYADNLETELRNTQEEVQKQRCPLCSEDMEVVRVGCVLSCGHNGHVGDARDLLHKLETTIAASERLKAQLEEMTIDRDLWQSDHNEGCPNAASLESIKSLHTDIIDQGRKVQIAASGESKYGAMSDSDFIEWALGKLEGK